MKAYMKKGLLWEDPLDGKGPEYHKSQRKGARQDLVDVALKLEFEAYLDRLEMMFAPEFEGEELEVVSGPAW